MNNIVNMCYIVESFDTIYEIYESLKNISKKLLLTEKMFSNT